MKYRWITKYGTQYCINKTDGLKRVDSVTANDKNMITSDAVYRATEITKFWYGSISGNYVELANIPVSSGIIYYGSFEITFFGISPTAGEYPVGKIIIDISSGSDANRFSIRGWTDLVINNAGSTQYPSIKVYKETSKYKIYLASSYNYRRIGIRFSKVNSDFQLGNFAETNSPAGTLIYDSTTDTNNKIKKI